MLIPQVWEDAVVTSLARSYGQPLATIHAQLRLHRERLLTDPEYARECEAKVQRWLESVSSVEDE